jgi:hypothetical protein
LRPAALALTRAGQWQAAREHFAGELAEAVSADDELRIWAAQTQVAFHDIGLGEAERAVAGLAPAVDRMRELGRLRWQWKSAAVLMAARIEAGQLDAARAAMRETLMVLGVAGAPDFIGDHLASWAALSGAAEEAAGLLGWCDASLARRGKVQREELDQRACTRTEALIAAALPAPRAAALREAGRAWSDDEALHMLLDIAQREQRAHGLLAKIP